MQTQAGCAGCLGYVDVREFELTEVWTGRRGCVKILLPSSWLVGREEIALFGSLAKQIMSNPEGLAIARRLIAEEAEKRTGFLDLGELGLTELPNELFTLTHLRGLNLGRWFYDEERRDSINSLAANNFVTTTSRGQKLEQLAYVSLTNVSVTGLELLIGFENLRRLDCRSSTLKDLSQINKFPLISDLDIYNCDVMNLLPVANMAELRHIHLGSGAIAHSCDLTPLSTLTLLETLSCTRTQLRDLFPLSRLMNLRSIDFSRTAVSDMMPLANLANLHLVNCSETQVHNLTPLGNLTNLKSIDCSKTQITDLTPVGNLTNLQSIDCSFTQVNDLTPLVRLAELKSLKCSLTQVDDLAPLAHLLKLHVLEFDGTQVRDLTPLARLSNLQSLGCSGTYVNDLTPIARLSNLQSLYCNETHVSDLAPLIGLRSLTTLDANKCQLVSFPFALLRSEISIQFQLYGTVIPGIPSEVLSQHYYDDCRERLLGHVNDLQAGAEQVADVKVIVIGNGRIGKTQICNRLRGEPYEEQADSTHGITVTQTDLPMASDGAPVVLNLWDFGGQDLYHGTHSLFLKSRALFVVVWTPKAETNVEYEHGGMRFRNQPLPYWLEYVRNAAGSVCPVVLVQNQCDTPQDEVRQPPADSELLDAFPYLQQVHYSAREDRKRDSLNEALREAIKHLRGQEGIATIGKGRMKVRRQLQQWLDEDSHRERDQRQNRTLTQEQFRRLCTTAGDVSSPDSLLEYLHNAGIVFYRKGLFGDSIVLDQSWALDAIYTVFNRQQCYRQLSLLGGRFTRSLLEALVWPVEKYSQAERELFLSMMESCGICFKHREADYKGRFEAEYVAPDLLPDRASVADQLAGRWDDDGPKAERAWSFDFLHPGLVRSIISTVGSKAGETAVYWKYGVWFYDANTRAAAIIAQEMRDDRRGRIVLQAQGARARDLLALVTEWIADKLRDAGTANFTEDGESIVGSKPDPIVPEDRRSAAEEAIRITDPPRPANQTSACVSYAWKEERSADPERAGKVELFCTKLTDAGRSIIRDTTHVALSDRLSKFMRQIGHSDRIYVFLSDAYLKSPNCMYELLTIWNTSGDDEELFRLRTRVFTMPGTDVFSIPARLKYAAHWKNQLAETLQAINENGVDVLGPTDLKNFKQMQDFAHHVNEMLAQIVDVLQPREFDQYIDRAIDEL